MYTYIQHLKNIPKIPPPPTLAHQAPWRVESPSSRPTPPWSPPTTTWTRRWSTAATPATSSSGRRRGPVSSPASSMSSRPLADVSLAAFFVGRLWVWCLLWNEWKLYWVNACWCCEFVLSCVLCNFFLDKMKWINEKKAKYNAVNAATISKTSRVNSDLFLCGILFVS